MTRPSRVHPRSGRFVRRFVALDGPATPAEAEAMLSPSVRLAVFQLQSLIPDPWNFPAFIDNIRTFRNRRLLLRRLNLSDDGGISAAWVPTESRDVIFYSASAHAYRRIALILHELAHMFLGHAARDLGFEGEKGLETLEQMLLDKPSPELLRNFGMLLRHDYLTPGESDAEYVARLVLSAIKLKDDSVGSKVASTFGW